MDMRNQHTEHMMLLIIIHPQRGPGKANSTKIMRKNTTPKSIKFGLTLKDEFQSTIALCKKELQSFQVPV